jgi:hypothetical protein
MIQITSIEFVLLYVAKQIQLTCIFTAKIEQHCSPQTGPKNFTHCKNYMCCNRINLVFSNNQWIKCYSFIKATRSFLYNYTLYFLELKWKMCIIKSILNLYVCIRFQYRILFTIRYMPYILIYFCVKLLRTCRNTFNYFYRKIFLNTFRTISLDNVI